MMFVAGTVLVVIFLIISVILFFRNDVPKLIGGITGYKARKAIKQMQRNDKRHRFKTEVGEKVRELSDYNKTKQMAEEAVTLKLCSETETGLLSEEQEESVPEVFKVLEDITEFYGKEEESEEYKI